MVSEVKRLFEAEKAGHAGTLDPLASGMLPIALGEATKTVSFIMDGSKSLSVQHRLGRGDPVRRWRDRALRPFRRAPERTGHRRGAARTSPAR